MPSPDQLAIADSTDWPLCGEPAAALIRSLSNGHRVAEALADQIEDRTVTVASDIDESVFFTTETGQETLVDRYDLEHTLDLAAKATYIELDRYWVNEPYAFVSIFYASRENERKYIVVEPYLTPVERHVRDFLEHRLRTALTTEEDQPIAQASRSRRRAHLERTARSLLRRYGLLEAESTRTGLLGTIRSVVGGLEADTTTGTHGRRPEPAALDEERPALSPIEVDRVLYYLIRDFVGYDRIDPIKRDVAVEDISCDGWGEPVFVYHADHEQLITNVSHGQAKLDDFVISLAQRSAEGISKRRPQVDASLPDGSRAQLTLGTEVTDGGTNYTIRQFTDIPFTPIDLVNWGTFTIEQLAYLWLCIEHGQSLLLAGGTASGKTTALNAISLFIPSDEKIVSIEDTREVELPQRNWIASVTRPGFTGADNAVDEFDLLQAALRQRPDYLVMGEVRGEEGRTLFQVMSTGHTTYTTFHAGSVDEVIKRFTTDPINVSKTMFSALDLIAIQAQTRVGGASVRRNKVLTEINHYDPGQDEINVQDVFRWRAGTDHIERRGPSRRLEAIRRDRGWSDDRLRIALRRRRAVLAYLVDRGLRSYADVAATIQGFMADRSWVLDELAADRLRETLPAMKDIETIDIDGEDATESLVPRPTPDDRVAAEARAILHTARGGVLDRNPSMTRQFGSAHPHTEQR